MYKDYYKLDSEPFNITPDPKFLYMTPRHRDALNHLLYGVRQRKGFICLTGEVGAGKTTLCRALLNELGPQYHTALILNPMLTGTQLLRAIVQEFSIASKRTDRLGYLTLLNKHLLALNSVGHEAVLIIDEAQDMPDDTLELTRLLSNLETDSHKLLQIVLLGQEELRTKLAKPAFRQLAQRITVRFHLGRMTAKDTEAYIRHRLAIAGGMDQQSPSVQFDSGAIREVFRFSRGTPRLINAVSDKAMLAGFAYGSPKINRRMVRIAIKELKEAI